MNDSDLSNFDIFLIRALRNRELHLLNATNAFLFMNEQTPSKSSRPTGALLRIACAALLRAGLRSDLRDALSDIKAQRSVLIDTAASCKGTLKATPAEVTQLAAKPAVAVAQAVEKS